MGIDLSKLHGRSMELAINADKNSGCSNGKYLDNEKEISLFLESAKVAIKNGELEESDINAIFGFEKIKMIKDTNAATKKNTDSEIAKNYVENFSQNDKEEITYTTRTNTENEYNKMAHDLDSMMIENGMLGTTTILERMPEYDFEKLLEKYSQKQDTYNDVNKKIESWYEDPNIEKSNIEDKTLLEDTINDILGMDYNEYQEKYASEIKEVSVIPPVIRGYSSWAAIVAHEEAVSKLSDSAKKVYEEIKTLNNYLYQNFKSWQNDMIYESSNKTQEMGASIINDLSTVEYNENAKSINGEIIGFEMPENWLVKKNFIEAIENKDIDVSVNDIEVNNKKNKPKKILKDGKIVIEKTSQDGMKIYYDLSGKEIK